LYANYFNFARCSANQPMTKSYGTLPHIDNFGTLTSEYSKPTAMGKQERKEQTLELIVESNMAFTPYVLFRNLQLRGATFEYRSVKRYVSELHADGWLEKIEYDQRRHLYLATDKAHNKFRDSETERKKKQLAD
jgi:hypothetical protein